jgi:FKBP-type peptidyl-prolyl cis-trans isomerase FkpA
MKKYLLLFSVVVLGLSACKKGDVTAEQASIDDRKIQAYIAANYPTTTSFTKDASGLYYSVVKAGTGPYPTASSKVQVAYTGKYLNGATFTASNSVTLTLADNIKGWQIGLLHINGRNPDGTGTAGRIILIIPSALAYGATGSGDGAIPPNTPLIFTIDLIGIGS